MKGRQPDITPNKVFTPKFKDGVLTVGFNNGAGERQSITLNLSVSNDTLRIDTIASEQVTENALVEA